MSPDKACDVDRDLMKSVNGCGRGKIVQMGSPQAGCPFKRSRIHYTAVIVGLIEMLVPYRVQRLRDYRECLDERLKEREQGKRGERW